MHEELDAPDSFGRGVAVAGGPGWELFGECADVGPFSGAGNGYSASAGFAEERELGGCEDRRDEDEAVLIEGIEVWEFCHGGRLCESFRF